MEAMLCLWIASAFVCAAIGGNKNSAGTGCLVGLLLGPLGIPLAFVVQDGRPKCPFCKGVVVKGAVACKNCGRDLTPPGP